MLNYENDTVREKLFDGLIGLEREGLRVTEDGFFSKTPHPFDENDPYIVRDFCENQTEINTAPKRTAKEAYSELLSQTRRIKSTLSKQDVREYLWPFSNPPYIRNENDIPIAQFKGENASKTEYREYLSTRYGRYKMTFSGIHFNYSFGEDLLREDFRISGGADFDSYKDNFYVSLAASAQMYNWLVVAVTAASPLLDSSYFEKGKWGEDVYNGMASSRCSDIGYWNFFTPILDYKDITSYVSSIDNIVKNELIRSPSELYFPVRVKPPGSYSQEALRLRGANHIELRMIDLNPLDEAGIDVRDVHFLQMFLIFLACKKMKGADANAQIKAIADTKNAARFDLKTVHLVDDDQLPLSIADAAIEVIDEMRDFFVPVPKMTDDRQGGSEYSLSSDLTSEYDLTEIESTLLFERNKFTEIENRYAWKVRELFSGGFVRKGMQMLTKESLDIAESCT